VGGLGSPENLHVKWSAEIVLVQTFVLFYAFKPLLAQPSYLSAVAVIYIKHIGL